MKLSKFIAAAFLLVILSLNIFSLIYQYNPYTKAKIMMSSLSAGDRYFGRLTLWYLFAADGDWNQALQLESGLNPVDILAYKVNHHPSELKKSVNNLIIKPHKSIEDWLELARVDSIIDKKAESFDALTKAKSLDPIRDDISQLYYQSSK